MESGSNEPDDSSIKPVSSLRSQFEHLSTSKSPAPKPQKPAPHVAPKPIPIPLIQPNPSESDSSPVNDLNAKDIPEPPANTAPKPKKRPPTPPQPRKISHRPQVSLTQPITPSDVISAGSPSKSIDVAKRSLTPSRPLTPSGLTSDAPLARPSGHSRSPSTPHLSRVERQGSSSLLALDVATSSASRKSSLPNPPPKAPKPAPPVNRRAKPALQPQDAIPVPDHTNGPKVSPFNTPPSSGEASPPETPPPLPLNSKPKTSTFSQSPQPVQPLQLDKARQTEASFAPEDAPPPILPPRRQVEVSSSQENLAVSTIKRSALNQGFANKGVAVPGPRPPERYAAITNRTLTPSPQPSSEGRRTPQSHKYQQSPVLSAQLDNGHPPASASISTSSEYPDSSNANRRPPYFSDGPRMISTGYDLRITALSGEYLCATGPTTKVWNISTGKLILNMVHGEGTKITSLSFKPATKLEEDGTRLWLGTNWGELLEVDISSKKVVANNSDSHHRHEVTKILRHGFDLWTLDDEGKLFVWPADKSKSPSLSRGVYNGRLGRRPSAALVVGDELWVAFGKDIRVFRPDIDAETAQSLNLQSMSQQGAGDVTCATTIDSQPDLIYFGHSDGKITIYSRKSHACVDVVTISIYKVNTLAGIGEYLWAGNSTGSTFVYEITSRPWKIKKDWRVHDGALIGITTDTHNIWKSGRFMVVTIGLDHVVYVWDGLLEEDWLENDMLSHGTEYSQIRELDSLVVSWNTGASKPTDLRYDEEDSNFFRELLEDADTPDILTFGLQELVDLEDKTLTAKSFFKSKHKDPYGQEYLSSAYRAWRDYLTGCLEEAMPLDEPYVLLQTASLVGLFTCIFVKASLKSKIKDVQVAEIKTGMGGLHGNKGAIVVRFILEDSSICFVNCHLAAGQTKTAERNNDLATILDSFAMPREVKNPYADGIFVHGGDGSMIMDNEICILSGDLNYRIDAMTRDAVVTAVQANNLNKLLERDQLLLSRRKNPSFKLRAFSEMPLNFHPTYKYNVGTDTYDTSEKRRPPAWCDRILCRGHVEQVDYQRHEVRISDHRPVSANFKFKVKTINREKRDACRKQSLQRFQKFKDAASTEAKLEYLQTTFGLSKEEARAELGL